MIYYTAIVKCMDTCIHIPYFAMTYRIFLFRQKIALHIHMILAKSDGIFESIVYIHL